MTNIDKIQLRPEPPMRQPGDRPARSASAWPRTLAMVGILAAGAALGASGLALAAGMDQGWRQGARLAFVQRTVERALDGVGASSEQEAKIHDIIAAKFAEIATQPGDHEALRKQALDLLAAPTIDRAAVERLRADAVSIFDMKSKGVVAGLLEVADQLTPQQRAQLVAQFAEHGPMGGFGEGRHSPPADTGPGKD